MLIHSRSKWCPTTPLKKLSNNIPPDQSTTRYQAALCHSLTQRRFFSPLPQSKANALAQKTKLRERGEAGKRGRQRRGPKLKLWGRDKKAARRKGLGRRARGRGGQRDLSPTHYHNRNLQKQSSQVAFHNRPSDISQESRNFLIANQRL